MIDHVHRLITNQFEASFSMLQGCIARCAGELWNAPVANLTFSQAAFHALFFADLYLGENVDVQRRQRFHQHHKETFGDYEELADRPQQTHYEKSFINDYLWFCLNKAREVIAAETAESLDQRCGFDWLDISRGELHVYNLRHLQHHAAQLSLHLRLKTGEGVAWTRSGWPYD